MSNEIAHFTDNAPTVMQSQQSSGAMLSMQAQAQSMQAAWSIAEMMCSTSLVPKSYQNKPAEGTAAIMYGAELGLNPIQSLQQVMVINGKPSIEARTMVALLKMRGYRFTTDESSPQRVTVTGTSPNGEVETSTWTFERAQKAGFTRNKLYNSIPEQMLYAKAATEVCRRLAPDVLLGISYSTEEMQLGFGESEPVKATAERVDAPTPTQEQPVSAQQQTVINAASTAADDDSELQGLYALMRASMNMDELNATFPILKPYIAAHPEHRDALNEVWLEVEHSFGA